MGCFASKEQSAFNSPYRKKGPNGHITQLEKDIVIRSHLLNAIKRRDPILFEKAIQQYEARCLEYIGSPEEQKTLLHHIAEQNFAEGMSLALEYITQFRPQECVKTINSKDSQGNTPLITCCLYNSGETLEVLSKYDKFIDHSAKNQAGKTALEVATEKESPLAHMLQFGGFALTGGSTGTGLGGSTYFNHSPMSPKSQLAPRLGTEEAPLAVVRRDSGTLKSVGMLTKDKSNFENTKLYQLLKRLEESNSQFVDEEFPHDVYSMVNAHAVQDLIEKFEVLKWENPAKFLSNVEEVKIFEGIDLNDVSQSLIAGCDLYSALAAMVEFPQRLLKIFTTKEVNKQGAYSVNFFISGIPIEIMLDDYFPCIQNSQLLFSRPLKNELWFLLLEKAFAKLYGNYMEVHNVYISEAFEIMTGMPSSQHPLRDAKEDDLWSNMMEYDKKNYIVCAGTYPKSVFRNRIFLVSRLYEVEHTKIIKLINPFGDFEWKGNLSAGSTKMTKQMKEELGYYEGDNSSFYLELKEFIAEFDFLSVCHYHDNWIRNSKEVLASPGKSVFFELKLDREMDIFISVHQKLPRFVNEAPDYDISPVEIILAEENHGKLKGIAFGEKDALLGKNTVYATDKIKLRLSEGKYVLRTKIRWSDGKPHEFALNTFSQYPIHIKEVEKEYYPDFLKNVYLDAGERSTDKFTLGNKCEFGSSWAGSHLWLYAKNSGDKIWHLDIFFENMTNLKLCPEYSKEDNVIGLVVNPGEKVVTYVKRITDDTVELRWRFKQSWESPTALTLSG